MAISRKTNDAPMGVQLDRLPKLADEISAKKQKVSDAATDHAGIYKRAEKMGFHKKALKDAVKLRDMEPAKRNDYLASLNTYLDKLGVNDQGDLWADAPRGVGPNNGGGETVSDNAAHLQGEKAGKRGERADTNPYPADAAAHGKWAEGWMAGQTEAVRRNIKPLDPGSETQASA